MEFFDSTYELRRFKALDRSELVKDWTKKHGLKLPYKLHRRRKRYVPDILVRYNDGRTYLEEVKGYVYRPAQFAMKNGIAKAYCTAMGWTYRLVWLEGLERVE